MGDPNPAAFDVAVMVENSHHFSGKLIQSTINIL